MSISTTKFASKNHFFERRMSLCCSTYLLHIYLTMQNKLTNYIFFERGQNRDTSQRQQPSLFILFIIKTAHC